MSIQITLRQFKNLIMTSGEDVTFIGAGEVGIGKSSVLASLAQDMPGHQPCYIDCTLLDLGDFALPYTVDENGMRVTRFAPNARFGFQLDRPVIIMLDEIGKAMRSVKNVLLTLMLEHRIGDVALPKGSIVFGTTNMATDGVGDSMEAHARNRVCFVTIAKPQAGFTSSGAVEPDSWGAWALDNDIDPVVLAWVREFPHALASYTEGDAQKDNPYIFNPVRAGQTAFVTPRSLEKASDIAKRRDVLGHELTMAAMAGCIGESAARDMDAFFRLADTLPSWDEIVKDPAGTPVPESIPAWVMLASRAVTKIEAKTLGPWLDYLERLPMEIRAMFYCAAANSKAKQQMVLADKQFRTWAIEHNWIVRN